MLIDIIELSKYYEKNTIRNVIVYGIIEKEVGRPTSFVENILVPRTGCFVKLRAYIIDLSSQHEVLKKYKSKVFALPADSYITVLMPKADYYPGRLVIAEGALNIKKGIATLSVFKKQGDLWQLNDNRARWVTPNREIPVPAEYNGIWESIVRGNQFELPESLYKAIGTKVEDNIAFNELKTHAVKEYEDNVRISTTSNNKIYENRQAFKSFDAVAQKLQDSLNIAKTNSSKYITSLKYKHAETLMDPLSTLVNGLLNNMSNRPQGQGTTGRLLLRGYLQTIKGWNTKHLGTTFANMIIDNFENIRDYLLYNGDLYFSTPIINFCHEAFGNKDKFYAAILSQILSIDLIPTQVACETNDLSFINIVNTDVYLLTHLQTLSFTQIYKIAQCFGQEQVSKVCLLNHNVLSSQNNTAIRLDSNFYDNMSISITEAQYNNIIKTGYYTSLKTVANMYAYCNIIMNHYNLVGFSKQYRNYVKKFSPAETNVALQEYLDTGLGIRLDNNFIASTLYVNKELFIYNKLKQLANNKTNFTKEQMDPLISEYERLVGFKLEQEQRNAVYLLVNKSGVISGCAGSGKTTVSRCLIYVLSRLAPEIEYKFAAPTGKAAKRMQEVIHEKVYTINRLFKLGLSVGSNLFDEDSKKDKFSSHTAFFIDECGMPTVDTYYEMLKRIPDGAYLYLFGDFHQLPPIGKGLAFKDMLEFMPCQHLKVSKRAAEGSQITHNSDIVNNFSDKDNWLNLESGKDFFLLPSSEEQMLKITTTLIKYLLNKPLDLTEENILKGYLADKLPDKSNIKPDDIQIVSPLAQAKYSWGTYNLNKLLQPIFNSNRGYDKTICSYVSELSYVKFVIGDRVIHTNKNCYSMQWYSEYDAVNKTIRKINGYEICNGEIGHIVDYVKAEDLTFLESQEELDLPTGIRDDATYKVQDAYFVVVKYYDYLDNRDFYILYRAVHISTNNNVGISLQGEDLDNLMLFYAGTTHKMQGSQAKLIISVLGNVGYKGFITRNMMYTIYTRGIDYVYAIGSVENEPNSMLSKARTDIAEANITTILNHLMR